MALDPDVRTPLVYLDPVARNPLVRQMPRALRNRRGL